jgi:serine/threonine-protein kinase
MAEDFGTYRLHRLIAAGSFSEVFLAEAYAETPPADGERRPLVIKRLHRELARLPEHVELFREEGRLAQQLEDRHLVHAFEAGQVGDHHYIAMELVQGPNLAQLLALERPPVARALAIVCEVASGLDHVHRSGLVHCDVGPSNILVGPERTQLTDFGVASAAGHPQRQVRGTFAYMSPEQARGERLDRRSDVFSLGAVLWELLKHAPLFQRRERYLTLAAVVEDPTPSIDDAGLAPLEPILQRALAKDPADRFESCLTMVAALREAMPT